MVFGKILLVHVHKLDTEIELLAWRVNFLRFQNIFLPQNSDVVLDGQTDTMILVIAHNGPADHRLLFGLQGYCQRHSSPSIEICLPKIMHVVCQFYRVISDDPVE